MTSPSRATTLLMRHSLGSSGELQAGPPVKGMHNIQLSSGEACLSEVCDWSKLLPSTHSVHNERFGCHGSWYSKCLEETSSCLHDKVVHPAL